MYSKYNQLKKAKKDNPKRMCRNEYHSYIDKIRDFTKGKCQICKELGQDIHHVRFGSRGADKDDRYILILCRDCHEKCHKDKHGFNNIAVTIAEANYERFLK